MSKIIVDARHMELLRNLVAAQAALFDVMDVPDSVETLQVFGVMMASASRITRDLMSELPKNGGTH